MGQISAARELLQAKKPGHSYKRNLSVLLGNKPGGVGSPTPPCDLSRFLTYDIKFGSTYLKCTVDGFKISWLHSLGIPSLVTS